jgi:transposase
MSGYLFGGCRDGRVMMGTGMETVVIRERRRAWSDADKFRIVQETLVPDISVSAVARRHDIAPSQLFSWRKQLLAGALSGFVPVSIIDDAPSSGRDAACDIDTDHKAAATQACYNRAGTPDAPLSSVVPVIEVLLENGCCVRVPIDIAAARLQQIVHAVAAGVAVS